MKNKCSCVKKKKGAAFSQSWPSSEASSQAPSGESCALWPVGGEIRISAHPHVRVQQQHHQQQLGPPVSHSQLPAPRVRQAGSPLGRSHRALGQRQRRHKKTTRKSAAKFRIKIRFVVSPAAFLRFLLLLLHVKITPERTQPCSRERRYKIKGTHACFLVPPWPFFHYSSALCSLAALGIHTTREEGGEANAWHR